MRALRWLWLLLVAAPLHAQVAFDAATDLGTGTTDLTNTHTPVGTPAGAVVIVTQRGVADEISSVTYAGLSMTEVAGSPASVSGTESGAVRGFFLSAPTAGAQTVTVTVSGSSVKAAAVVTYTAMTSDTAVQATDSISEATVSTTTDTATLALSAVTSAVIQGWYSGLGAIGANDSLTGWTFTRTTDFGADVARIETYDTIGSSDVTFGFDAAGGGDTEEFVALAIAITESSGGSNTSLRRRRN